MSLTDKILSLTKNNVYASVFSDSELLKRKTEYAPTNVPMLNVALSGKWEGGLSSGITILAGPSRNGKTYIGLILVKAYLEKYPDAVCVFLDSELGASKMYFDRLGIDTARIIHIPLTNIEEAKFQCVKIFEGLSTNDHCMFFFDSIGNLASKKELDDAQNEKSVADMSRAKQLKSFFRIITPYVNLKNVPFVGINHTYQTTDFFPQEVMGGGTGCLLSADTVFFMGKAKDKDGKELTGFDFKLKVHKSRCVKETKVFCLNSSFEEGIDKYSDLFEFALEKGFITSPSKGFYQKAEKYCNEKKYRKSEFDRNDETWKDIIEDEEFKAAYEKEAQI